MRYFLKFAIIFFIPVVSANEFDGYYANYMQQQIKPSEELEIELANKQSYVTQVCVEALFSESIPPNPADNSKFENFSVILELAQNGSVKSSAYNKRTFFLIVLQRI